MHSKRLKNTFRAQMQNIRAKQLPSSHRESYHSIVVGTDIVNIPKTFQSYRSKEEYLKDDNSLVFVDLAYHNMQWLSSFASKIIDDGQDSRYPFLNNEFDITNPGICCFRICDNEENCLHTQVRKLDKYPWLFLLDCFGCEEDGIFEDDLIMVCDISNIKQTTVDVVNSKFSPSVTQEYASRLGGVFKEIMIYMRPWVYAKDTKTCEIIPFTNISFPQAAQL